MKYKSIELPIKIQANKNKFEACKTCVNDYDDPQMCKFCKKGSCHIAAQ